MSDRSAVRAFTRKLTRSWLAAVDRATTYTAVNDLAELPPEALASSGFWCGSFLPSCADPHESGVSPRTSLHVGTRDTPDLIAYDYVVNGLAVALIESRNLAMLRVARESADVLARASAERPEEIRKIALAIFGGDDHPCVGSFELPKVIEEGATFSTNPAADPLLLATWKDRVDGGIRRGCLYFLFYKRLSQEIGFRDDRAWFDEAHRAPMRVRLQAEATKDPSTGPR